MSIQPSPFKIDNIYGFINCFVLLNFNGKVVEIEYFFCIKNIMCPLSTHSVYCPLLSFVNSLLTGGNKHRPAKNVNNSKTATRRAAVFEYLFRHEYDTFCKISNAICLIFWVMSIFAANSGRKVLNVWKFDKI